MLRKVCALVLVVSCILTMGLAGCSGKKETSSKITVSEPVKAITITIWRGVREQTWTDYFKSVCDRYNNSQKSVIVGTQEIGANQLDIKLNAAYASGTEPEIVSTGLYNIAPRAELGQFAALDEFFNNWNDKNDILDNIVELGRYKDKLYGIGFFPDPKVFFYRKDYFVEAGLDPNKPPQTWEELEEYAVKLTKKEGDKVVRAGFDINPSDWYLTYSLIRQNGGDMIDKANTVPTLDSPESIGALEFLTNLYKKNVSIPVAGNASSTVFENLFYTGKAAMAYASMYGVKGIIDNDPSLKDKIGYSTPIKNKVAATFSGVNFNFISSDAKNKDACWDFLKFFMSKEENWERYKRTYVPVVRKSLEAAYLADDPVNKAIFESVAVGRGNPKVAWSDALSKGIVEATELALYGKKSPADAMKYVNEKIIKENTLK